MLPPLSQKAKIGVGSIAILLIAVIIVVSVLVTGNAKKQAQHGPGWGYHGDHGPSLWHKIKHYEDCGGERQSPVDLNRNTPTSGTAVNFIKYDEISSDSHFHNNGHSDQDEPDSIGDSKMNGGPLDGDYILSQFHFHWGLGDKRGSEHTIDGQRFPLEMHLVNKHVTKGDSDLAVAGFLFEISPEDNPNLKPISDNLKKIHESGSEAEVHDFSIEKLIHNATKGSYFNYRGSLTTPPCSEIVNWIIFDTKIPISSNQVHEFRESRGENGEFIVDNFRPTQDLNGRAIKYITP